MIRTGLAFFGALWLAAFPARAATNSAPDFQEVLSLLRTHLSGATDADLNRTAVESLLTALHGKVTLLGGSAAAAPTNPAPLIKSSLIESNIAYLRVGTFEASLAQEISAVVGQLASSNKLIGLVIDLRFADGDDYAAAAAVADRFQAKARPLMDWGNGAFSSKAKSDAIKLPVGVLVNRETGGAAEALAAVLRETGAGLILGGTTEGSALIAEEFPLKNGQRLRVATTSVKVGEGVALTTRGVTPDIEISMNLEEERKWLDDPYGTGKRVVAADSGLSLTNQTAGTNRPVRRSRLNEADLVRARRDGQNLDGELPEPRNAEPPRPSIRDATLARAVDLLKGLAVVRASRS